MRFAIFVAAVVALALSAAAAPRAAGQGQLRVGVDADPQGNSPTSLGAVQDCRRVEVNDSFQIDVFVQEAPPLDGLQFALNYDPAMFNVSAFDVAGQMLGANPGSNVLDQFTESVPDSDGAFTVAGIDFAQPGETEEESGEGVLARITLTALAQGRSTLALTGVILTTPGAGQSESIFPSASFNANVAVGESCSPPPQPSPIPTPTDLPTPTLRPGETPTEGAPTAIPPDGSPQPGAPVPGPDQQGEPGEGDDGGLGAAGWAALGGGLAGAALLLAGAALLWARRRQT